MNAILVITLGVAILYLVISGKLDCFIKAIAVCTGTATNSDAAKTNTTAPASSTTNQSQALATLDRVLSPQI